MHAACADGQEELGLSSASIPAMVSGMQLMNRKETVNDAKTTACRPMTKPGCCWPSHKLGLVAEASQDPLNDLGSACALSD